MQAKSGTTSQVTTVQGSPKGLPQGATIVKLVGGNQVIYKLKSIKKIIQ